MSTRKRTRLVVVRHASTSLNGTSGNSSEAIRAWKDVPLSRDGIKEAHGLAKELKNVSMHGLYSSDLDRAEHTSRIVSKETGVPILGVLRRLRPWNLGRFTGEPTSKCIRQLIDYIANRPNVPVPDGEAFNDFRDRALSTLQELRERHPGESIGIITHHRLERLISAWGSAGGGTNWKIDPEEFRKKGIPPADYIIRVLAEADGDEANEADGANDADESNEVEARPSPKRKPASAPAYPWSRKPFDEPRPGPGKGIWSKAVGGPDDGTGLKSDKLDLKPRVPLPRRSMSWTAAVRNSLLER